MNLRDYLATEGALSVTELRKRIGAKSDAQVRQWQHGYAGRKPSPEYCTAIERVTDGAVTRCDLRPDDCEKIWSDLAPTGKRVKARA